MADLVGFYINLDRANERREFLQEQFTRLNLGSRYRRFTAIDGHNVAAFSSRLTPQESGCFMSHLNLLAEIAQSDTAFAHILEDDTVLSSSFDHVIDILMNNRIPDVFDILFLDIGLPINSPSAMAVLLDTYLKATTRESLPNPKFQELQIIDLKDIPFAGAASYIVSPSGAAKLCLLLEEAKATGEALPVDLVFRDLALAGRIKAGCTLPFLTTIRLAQDAPSQIRDDLGGGSGDVTEEEKRGRAARNLLPYFLLRQIFYIECNWDKVFSDLDRHFPLVGPTNFHVAFMRIIRSFYERDFNFI